MKFLYEDKVEKRLESLLDLNIRYQSYFVIVMLVLIAIGLIGFFIHLFLM